MTVRWVTAFLDTPRGLPGARAGEAFWARVTASEVSARRGERSEFATLLPGDGDAFLRVHDVDGGAAGVHVDLHVDDVAAEAARVVALGASVVRDDGSLVVVRSPAGLLFCLVPHDGERVRPSPVGWPDGTRSLVDQVCLDVGADVFDREAAFVAAVTGWERRAGSRPEFEVVGRAPGMPLRFLVQRVPAGQRAGAHLDVACDDRVAEARRHGGWGAEFVRAGFGWTTLRDPVGREYCVTGRVPGVGVGVS